jgi:D-alanyl-D-alanine carboxypeptidase
MTLEPHPKPRFRFEWNRGGLFRLTLAVVFLLGMATPTQAQSTANAVPIQSVVDTTPDTVRSILDSMRARYGFPGATAAYVWIDGPSGDAATGVANVEAGTPMTPDARMLAASIGKSFVAAAAAALAEEDVLDLDAPIARWLGDRPWFEQLPNHEAITLRHLLTHRSGLPDHVHLEAFAEAVARRWQESGNPFPPDTLIQFVLGRPALFEPGEWWAYSDTGYILAGLMIEAATGRNYYDLVQERFLAPLDLRHTSPSNDRNLPGLAAGYSPDNPFGWPTKSLASDGTLAWHPGMEWTGGGLVSTADNLARWGAALFGGTAVPEAALDQMLSADPVDPAQPDVRYGLGVAVYRTGPFGPVYGHGGWIPGYVSSLRYYADHGVAIAFQINTDDWLQVDSTSVVQALEARLAEAVLATAHRRTAERTVEVRDEAAP